MQLLLQLLKDVKESDTRVSVCQSSPSQWILPSLPLSLFLPQLSVMKVFSQLIEQVGVTIRPHIGALLEQLPQVWEEASGESSSMLCCAIVSTLTHTVASLGALSSQLHPFLLPVISTATDVKLVSLHCLGWVRRRRRWGRCVWLYVSSTVARTCLSRRRWP